MLPDCIAAAVTALRSAGHTVEPVRDLNGLDRIDGKELVPSVSVLVMAIHLGLIRLVCRP